MNYWIFQCNPKAYQIIAATLNDWNVKNYKKEIQKGDKAVIWITGENGGVYALADIETNPCIFGASEDHEQWNVSNEIGLKHKIEDKTALKVKIKVTLKPHKLLPKSTIKTIDGLQGFKAGSPGSYGTNLRLEKSEYEIIKGLIEIS